MSHNPGVAGALSPVEVAIWDDFLPALFGGVPLIEITHGLWTLFGHSVKQGGLGLQIPTAVADGLLQTLHAAMSHPAECLVAGTKLDLGQHWQAV